MENYMNDEEQEIDLRELFFALKKKALPILAVGLLCGCLACVGTKLLITPTYKSTSSMLTISKETTLTSIADIQLGTQLTKDYQVLIQSTPVLQEVIENTGLDMTVGELRECVSVSNPSDTRILEISVTYTKPDKAKEIVDEIAEVSADYIGDKMEVVPPKIIEKGQIPTHKAAPNVKKNTALGLLMGMILSAGLVVIVTVMNDSIKSEDDITKYLGIPTLASIPDRKDYLNTKRRKTKKKRGRKKGKK